MDDETERAIHSLQIAIGELGKEIQNIRRDIDDRKTFRQN